MELPLNRFKQGLHSGTTLFGLWLGIPDTTVAEIAAGAGFDWLLIDHEHGPFDVRTVLSHLQAAAPYAVASIVRPAAADPALIKKLLDIGAQSLLVPMIDTAEQAATVAAAVRYPPAGNRGLGTSMARAARWNRVTEYANNANNEICLIVQAESPRALDDLDAIVAVEGVDGVFIGPSDLSAAMGHLGNPAHPDVVAAVVGGLQKIRAGGKHAGVLCLDPSLAPRYEAAGASFIGVGVDTLILSQGFGAAIARFRHPEGSGQEEPPTGY